MTSSFLVRFLLAFLVIPTATIAQKDSILLWPRDASKKNTENNKSKTGEGLVDGKTVIRLGDVNLPSITFFPAPKATATGAAVIVCPGGGYSILAYDLEGTEVCQWLNSIGVTAILLKYRVPKPAELPRH